MNAKMTTEESAGFCRLAGTWPAGGLEFAGMPITIKNNKIRIVMKIEKMQFFCTHMCTKDNLL
jgi:hypothetical protein